MFITAMLLAACEGCVACKPVLPLGNNESDSDTEEEEELVVALADAVVEPLAVVVELLAAPVARAAVLGADSANHLAVGTHLDWVHLLEHVDEWKGRTQVAGVPLSCDEEADRENDRDYRDYVSKKGCLLVC